MQCLCCGNVIHYSYFVSVSLLLSVGEAGETLTYLKVRKAACDTVIKTVPPQQVHTVPIISIYPLQEATCW